MKRTWMAVLLMTGAWAFPAAAQDTRVRIERQDGQLVEVGVVAGFPTGLSAKYWVDRKLGVQAAAAWNPGTNGLTASADMLMHTESFSTQDEVSLPLYAGLGARVIEYDENTENGTWAAGPRIPVGVEAILRDLPVSFFVEVAPAVEVGRGDPDVTADAAVGARVIF